MVQLWAVMSGMVQLWAGTSGMVQLWAVKSGMVQLWAVQSGMVQLWGVKSGMAQLWTLSSGKFSRGWVGVPDGGRGCVLVRTGGFLAEIGVTDAAGDCSEPPTWSQTCGVGWAMKASVPACAPCKQTACIFVGVTATVPLFLRVGGWWAGGCAIPLVR